MARNRQQAKQRQAERRARRLEQQGDGAAAAPKEAPAPAAKDELGGLRPPPVEPPMDPNLAVGAPPQDEGRSDTVIEDEPHVDDHEDEHLTDEEVDAEAEAEAELAAGARHGLQGPGKTGRATPRRTRTAPVSYSSSSQSGLSFSVSSGRTARPSPP